MSCNQIYDNARMGIGEQYAGVRAGRGTHLSECTPLCRSRSLGAGPSDGESSHTRCKYCERSSYRENERRHAYGKGAAGRCAQDNKVFVVDDLLDQDELDEINCRGLEHLDIVLREGWRSAIFVPLDIGGRTAGVMAAYAIRPRAFFKLDVDITRAIAQRFCAGFVHIDRLTKLSEMETKLTLEASAIEAGMMALERVHDADNALVIAQGALSEITRSFRRDTQHPTYKNAAAAGSYVDRAHKTIKSLVNRAKTKQIRLDRVNAYELLSEAIDPVRIHAQTIGASITLNCRRDLYNSIFFLETDGKPDSRRRVVTGSCRIS